MLSNILDLAVGIAALAACVWAVRFFCRSDANGHARVTSLLGVYTLIYAIMFIGGAGLIFVGYGLNLDKASDRVVAKRAGTG